MAKSRRTKKRTLPRPRNPHARALKESGLFRPRVVAAKGPKASYRRRPKHPKPDGQEEG